MKKKTLVTAGAVMSIGLASVTGLGIANAATSSSSSGGTSLVDKIASTFNLNKADVQKVFDQDRSDREAQRQQEQQARLDQAVKDGKLTQDQADKIKAKQAEIQTFMDSLKDKTKDERKTAMKTEMDAVKEWETDNNIPKGYLMPGPGGHRGGGDRGPDDGGAAPAQDDSMSAN